MQSHPGFRSADDVLRWEVSGGRVVYYGDGKPRVVPAVSRADYSSLVFGKLPHNAQLESMLDRVHPVGSPGMRRFFSDRKIVTRQAEDGTVLASVTSNVWDAVNEVTREPLTERDRRVAGKGQRRVYELAQLLTDPYLLQKFRLSMKQINTAKSMAYADASAAAGYLQSALRADPDFALYEVVAGKYHRSRKWALTSISSAVADMSLVPAYVESAVIGEKLFIFGPGPEDTRWKVFGPLWYAAELRRLYAVVARAGPAQACFALGMELTLLDIDIADGDTVMSPVVELHAGPQSALPDSASAETDSLLSTAGRLKIRDMGHSLEPVFVDSEQVACAVRVSRAYVLVNSHVIQSGTNLRIGSCEAIPDRMVAKDLWLVRAPSPGFSMSWTLRDPVVSEQVIVCYLKGDRVQYTSPVTLRTADGVTLVTSLGEDLKPGMSGGAIIGLRDMAFLGVYSGVSTHSALGAAFTPEHYVDLCTAEEVSGLQRAAVEDQDGSLYGRMRAAGYQVAMDAVIESLRPLYDGHVHVGMGYHMGREFRTTCDADKLALTVGAEHRGLVFEAPVSGVFVSRDTEARPLDAGPLVVRLPHHGESVFVVGRDADGPYTSDLTVVKHIGVASRTFMVVKPDGHGSLPLAGGLIVATVDGAVVGQYAYPVASETLGGVVVCLSVSARESGLSVVESDLVSAVGKLFPTLHVDVWPDGQVEEAFTHSSSALEGEVRGVPGDGNVTLGMLGAAVLQLVCSVALRDAGVPASQWQRHIRASLSDESTARTSELLGLPALLKTGRGVKLRAGSRAHAAVLRALIALVFLNETFDVLVDFCSVVDLVVVGD